MVEVLYITTCTLHRVIGIGGVEVRPWRHLVLGVGFERRTPRPDTCTHATGQCWYTTVISCLEPCIADTCR
jgi:hypothetical protein